MGRLFKYASLSLITQHIRTSHPNLIAESAEASAFTIVNTERVVGCREALVAVTAYASDETIFSS